MLSQFQVIRIQRIENGHMPNSSFDSRHFCVALLRIPTVALLCLARARTGPLHDQAQSPWQFFQKRLLQLLFIQCLGLDKLYREQCQSIRLNPTFFGPRTGVGRQAANCGVGFQCFTTPVRSRNPELEGHVYRWASPTDWR